MKTLNIDSTKIFCALLSAMEGRPYKKLLSDPYMPLTIERLGGDFLSIWGAGEFYSLCHYYEQNGDLMQDPEMCFLVVDNRRASGDFNQIHVVPCTFQNASLGIYEESISFMSGQVGIYLPKMHSEHLKFAATWLANIKQQGFIK